MLDATSAPGVHVEEISSGPRPITLAGTNQTAFVGLLTLPPAFVAAETKEKGLKTLPQPVMSNGSAVRAAWSTKIQLFEAETPAQSTYKRIKPEQLRFAKEKIKQGATTEENIKLEEFKNDWTKNLKDIQLTGAIKLSIAENNQRTIQTIESTPTPQPVSSQKDLEGWTPNDDKELADIWDEIGDHTLSLSQSLEYEEQLLVSTFIGSVLESHTVKSHSEGDQIKFEVRKNDDLCGFFQAPTTYFKQIKIREDSVDWAFIGTSEEPEKESVLALFRAGQLAILKGLASVVDTVPKRPDTDNPQESTKWLENLQEKFRKPAPSLSSLEDFEAWQNQLAEDLFIALYELLPAKNGSTKSNGKAVWRSLSEEKVREPWRRWVKSLQGMLRLEVAIRGFFQNGGRSALLACAFQTQDKAFGAIRQKFLKASFDTASQLAMIAAPGLSREWQEDLVAYAEPRSLFAVLDTPRYLLTLKETLDPEAPAPWREEIGYEQGWLDVRPRPEMSERRDQNYLDDKRLGSALPRDDRGFGAGYAPWIVVDNPHVSGPHDRYVVAPPSGHIAGMIANTDMKAGGGVHKAPANELLRGVRALVTDVSDTEQGQLNARHINLIRRRPTGEIRCWGARTTAIDPLWRYVNVRRLFLAVERSVRDAIQWAVFLPNTDATRNDLKSTIMSFLYRMYMEGALDGRTSAEAYQVQCDRNNNPDPDVRNGILTVDIALRPVFPAEFIRLRFRQSPMSLEMTEG